jgi:hypothetical protein
MCIPRSQLADGQSHQRFSRHAFVMPLDISARGPIGRSDGRARLEHGRRIRADGTIMPARQTFEWIKALEHRSTQQKERKAPPSRAAP